MHVYDMDMHIRAPATVGVVGAAGYTGIEILRLLARHDGIVVRFATSSREAGAPSGVSGVSLCAPEAVDPGEVDVLFLCVPHGKAVGWAERARACGTRVVDLTADHRPGSGLADLAQDDVGGAGLVANPGCYPTGALLALEPLAAEGLLDTTRPVVVNAASGVTGAGRAPRRDLMFAEVAGDFRAYATGNVHRHLREMRALLPELQLLFQPHLLPISRGILETIYVPVAEGSDAERVRRSWTDRYADNPTIRIVDEGVPSLSQVVGTDLLALGAVDNEAVEPAVVTAVVALDNLGKGAAGQAVQNMNLMLGFPPEEGLRC